MPVDKQVNIRYEVLNKCFRDLYNEYTIDDLVEECNEALERHFDKTKTVSKRTVQDDIAPLQESPYSIAHRAWHRVMSCDVTRNIAH